MDNMNKHNYFLTAALLCICINLQATEAPQQRTLIELKRAMLALTSNISSTVAAVKACNDHNKLYSPDGTCNAGALTNIATEAEDVSVWVGYCSSRACLGNGFKGSTCNIFTIKDCPAAPNNSAPVVLTGTGAHKVLNIKTCKPSVSFYAHQKGGRYQWCEAYYPEYTPYLPAIEEFSNSAAYANVYERLDCPWLKLVHPNSSVTKSRCP
jgi:hypothetical protein